MKKLIWAIMQIVLGCCGLYTVVNSLITGGDNFVLGIIISIWIIPEVRPMINRKQKTDMEEE